MGSARAKSSDRIDATDDVAAGVGNISLSNVSQCIEIAEHGDRLLKTGQIVGAHDDRGSTPVASHGDARVLALDAVDGITEVVLHITGPRTAELHEQSVPQVGPGQLLVRACYTAVSVGTEIRMYRGEEHVPQNPPGYPMGPGYNMVGTVELAGPGVAEFAPGDRVFVFQPHQSWAVVEAPDAFRLPGGSDDARFAYALIAEIALHALRRCAPTFGESVAVFGQGVVGLAAIAVARAWGLRTIALDLDPHRLELSTNIGADLALLADSTDTAMRIREFAGPAGVDLALESASSWHAVRQAYQILRRGGRLCVVSRHTSAAGFNLLEGDLMTKEITLTSGYAHPVTDVPVDLARWTRPRNLELLISRIAEGRLVLNALVTHRIGPDELPSIYARLDRGDTSIGGVVVDWS